MFNKKFKIIKKKKTSNIAHFYYKLYNLLEQI